jgi:energy-coupling factor transport system permease protein
MLRGLKGILIFILASVVINMFFTKGDAFIDWYFIHISWQGFRTALYTMIRIILLVCGASVVTYTTTPTKLTDGLETGLRFLKLVKIPVHEISMMVSIALRFIPILVEELDKIMKAQQSRGADFESGNVIQRLKNLLPVILPMFVSAIRRANELANAMEARCYRGGDGRTKLKPLKYSTQDVIAYVLLVLYLADMAALRILMSQGLLERIYNMNVPV